MNRLNQIQIENQGKLLTGNINLGLNAEQLNLPESEHLADRIGNDIRMDQENQNQMQSRIIEQSVGEKFQSQSDSSQLQQI